MTVRKTNQFEIILMLIDEIKKNENEKSQLKNVFAKSVIKLKDFCHIVSIINEIIEFC